jgi:hypothetical protein
MTIILTILKKYWKLILIIVFALLVYLFFNQIQSLKKDNDRLLNNVEQLMSDNNTKVLEMTKQEFLKNYYDKDSLLRKIVDSINIRYKNIERTINYKYYHIYDTTVFLIETKDSTIKKFKHEFDKCVSVSGEINWYKSTITFDSLKLSLNTTTLYYWQRPHKFWFIKYGKKQLKAATLNNCSSKTVVNDITISKKK